MTVFEERPPLPAPEFPYPLGSALSGCVRWSCPEGCGWHHDEWPGREPGRIVLPADVETEGRTGAEVLAALAPGYLDRAITASATAREEARYLHVRAALDEHAQTAHSDHDQEADLSARPDSPPSVGSSAPPDSPPSAGRCSRSGGPRVDRALHQIRRATRLRPCPVCTHPVVEHALEGEHRVCSRGEGVRISCRVCAELWAYLPALPGLAALAAVARALSMTPPPPDSFTLA